MEWLYGRNVVKAALGAGARRRAHRLAATSPALDAIAALVPGGPARRHRRPRTSWTSSSARREHQGVALQVDGYPYADPDQLLAADVLVVLDEVTDPHNLGAVARSALAAGAGGLVVPRHRSAHVTPAAVKASAGTLEHLPVAQVTNVVSFLLRARDAGFWIYGAAGEAAASYLEHRPHGPHRHRRRRRGPRPAAARGAHLRRAGLDPHGPGRREPQRERRRRALPLRGAAAARPPDAPGRRR